ncbi:MAG TPA: hypothetical protein VJ201_02405 [Candidatus Babeliales bacterium]|nr:hypothetical protein [Candidatus Babeliales bacterium]
MKNKLMMTIIIIFSSTAMIAMELPDYSARKLKSAKYHAESRLEDLYSRDESDYRINNHCEYIRDALYMIEFSNSEANTAYPDEIGKISDEDMKKLKHTFYTKLQAISQKKAKKHIKQYADRNNFYQAARVVNMQNELCRDVIKAEDCDCAAIHKILKELLASEMQKKHESLEAAIQANPHILAKDIQGMTERSEKDILNKKQAQQKLNTIWNDMNNGKL